MAANEQESTLGPTSLAWKLVGDRRMLLAAGRALFLQVGHPAVSAGVDQFSDYKRNPWGRFERTLSMAYSFTYGGEQAVITGRKLREMHARIRGTDAHGHSYTALDREPYTWVHATLFETVHAVSQHFGKPLNAQETAQLYDEFRIIGRLYGVHDNDLPSDVGGFFSYYEHMLQEKLELTKVGKEVLESMKATPVHPKWSRYWAPAFWGMGNLAHFVTVGLLPETLRQRWSLSWTSTDEAAFRAFCLTVRTTSRWVPFGLRYHPDAKAAFRREAQRAA